MGSLDIAKAHLGWYLLTPRHESEKKFEKNSLRPDLGSIRLRVVYSLSCIFPLKTYEPLQSLLLQSLERQVLRPRVTALASLGGRRRKGGEREEEREREEKGEREEEGGGRSFGGRKGGKGNRRGG